MTTRRRSGTFSEDELNLVAERRKHLEGLRSDEHKTSDQATAAADAGEQAKSEAKPASEVPADGGVVPHPPGVDERTKAARQRAHREHTMGSGAFRVREIEVRRSRSDSFRVWVPSGSSGGWTISPQRQGAAGPLHGRARG